MTNILKKSISCCLLCCSLLLCSCGTETEAPDTIEDILNVNKKEQETETETEKSFFSAETETEFQPETETTTVQPETKPVMTEPATEPPPPVTEPVSVEISADEWEHAYRTFLEDKTYQQQVSADIHEADTRFLLLYLNADDIPELFIQTTMEVLIYAYHHDQVVYVDSFYPSHYTYNFYYRPYHNCLGSLQGSVMADGTYLEAYEYAEAEYSVSGFIRQNTYCYPTRDYSYEIYAERGMNIDLEKAPSLDIYPDRENNLGSSWLTVPDVLESSNSVQRYAITEEGLNTAFGEKFSEQPEETTER